MSSGSMSAMVLQDWIGHEGLSWLCFRGRGGGSPYRHRPLRRSGKDNSSLGRGPSQLVSNQSAAACQRPLCLDSDQIPYRSEMASRVTRWLAMTMP